MKKKPLSSFVMVYFMYRSEEALNVREVRVIGDRSVFRYYYLHGIKNNKTAVDFEKVSVKSQNIKFL